LTSEKNQSDFPEMSEKIEESEESEEGFDEFQDATPSSNLREGTLSND
jgi:hypothetical protein